MDIQTIPDSAHKAPPVDYHSNVDTSRPFSSVKEAVAVFGERLLTGEIYAYHKPNNNNDIPTFTKQESSPWKYSSSALSTPIQTSWDRQSDCGRNNDNPSKGVLITSGLKKLEAELEETKMELKLLKERESDTEVALATLNAELHKNMSKIAKAEAEEAARTRSAMVVGGNRRDVIMRMDQSHSSPTLAQILSIDNGGSDAKDQKKKKERKNVVKKKKKKPIIPLVGDLFSRKKESSNALHNPFFSSSHLFWN